MRRDDALALALLLSAVLCWPLVIPRTPQIVAAPVAQATPHTLQRIGPNAARPLRINEVGWLVSDLGSGDWGRCQGCTIELLDCNTTCTYRIVARRLDWAAVVDGDTVQQGGRMWLPWAGK